MAAIYHFQDLPCGGAVVILWRDLLVGRGQVKKPSVKKRLTDAAHWQIKRRALAFRHCIPSRLAAKGAIAQLRAPALQAGGRRFDPVWLHHFQLHLLVQRGMRLMRIQVFSVRTIDAENCGRKV